MMAGVLKQTSTWLGKLLLVSYIMTPLTYAAEQDAFANVTVKTTELAPGRYMLEGAGGNIGVSAGNDGLLIIDDQYAPMADKISAALHELHDGYPKYIINTHFHGDHVGGNNFFGQYGTIIAQTQVLTRLKEQRIERNALPVLVFDSSLEIHFNGQVMKLIHLGPAHTDSDTIVLWQDGKVAHTGDLFIKDRFPFIDLEHGGSVIGYRDAVAQILDLVDDNTQIIPGHGSLATKADLLRFKHMLDDCINWMLDGKRSSKTLDEMLATPLPERWQNWGWNFIPKERWVRTLYNGLPAQ
ncbi:MBL fold metallo-hydrolase [Shewanella sp. A32]|uniref:MBL fold metallo-hydrolase n=1 Tax=Shewanella sp. A32 TaxID=3031327 RepID=UPI0023B8AC1A|nr:MBL fold metallo-hydrolase [Shewanella sp. A32]MDF0534288.1 MBL fold metallo-hydrolase [Shewanella sp. A32]